MRKLVSRLVWLPLGFVLVVFMVANRGPVAVSLDPLSPDSPALATPALPLWIWLTAALLVGVLAGAAGMWMSGRDRRAKARAEHRELKSLKRELEATARSPEEIPTLKAS